jgi:hypothetical protein
VNKLIVVAARLQTLFDDKHWKFAFIGGIAVERWSEARTTLDVDLTLYTGFANEPSYVQTLLAHFPGRVANVEQQAKITRVVLLTSPENVGIDISLAGLPFEEGIIERSSLHEYAPSVFLRTCSAEDLIVLKAFANRDKDWLDIKGAIIRNAKLDWPLIERELAVLLELKEEPEILQRLLRLRDSIPAD